MAAILEKTIQRVWTRDDTVRSLKDIMHYWDSGGIRYERFITDNKENEKVWTVVSRSETPTGFVETLVEAHLYSTPANFTWKETVPFELMKGKEENGFRIPGWSVTWTPAKR
jgi:hypothetical protein